MTLSNTSKLTTVANRQKGLRLRDSLLAFGLFSLLAVGGNLIAPSMAHAKDQSLTPATATSAAVTTICTQSSVADC